MDSRSWSWYHFALELEAFILILAHFLWLVIFFLDEIALFLFVDSTILKFLLLHEWCCLKIFGRLYREYIMYSLKLYPLKYHLDCWLPRYYWQNYIPNHYWVVLASKEELDQTPLVLSWSSVGFFFYQFIFIFPLNSHNLSKIENHLLDNNTFISKCSPWGTHGQ